MSCSIGAFNAAYHTKMGVYHHDMGIKKGGKLAILAGAGPMGLGALTYALHRDVRPGMVVVTDINEDRLARAESLFPPKEVKEKDGIDLYFVNTANMADPAAELRKLTGRHRTPALPPRAHWPPPTRRKLPSGGTPRPCCRSALPRRRAQYPLPLP